MYNFPLVAFMILFLSLAHETLTMVCLGVYFLSLSCLGFALIFESIDLCVFFPKLGMFSTISFRVLLLAFFFSSLFLSTFSSLLLGLQDYNLCYSSWGSINVFKPMLFLLLRLYNFYCSVCSLILSSVSPFCC